MQSWLSSWFGDEVQRVSVQKLSEGPGKLSFLCVSLLSPPLGSLELEVPSAGCDPGEGVLLSACWFLGWKGAGGIPISCTHGRTHSLF